MIRFINLTGQISGDYKNRFAFFDTITNKFCEFSGSQEWVSINDFVQDYTGEKIDRFLGLMPERFKRGLMENYSLIKGKITISKNNE